MILMRYLLYFSMVLNGLVEFTVVQSIRRQNQQQFLHKTT